MGLHTPTLLWVVGASVVGASAQLNNKFNPQFNPAFSSQFASQFLRAGRQGQPAGRLAGLDCAADEFVHFELVTGQVYTAPTDMLDSRPGTLMLTDCIDICRTNSSCQAANFETGLCVLFSSSAKVFPGTDTIKMISSVYPLY